jgi:hypothetical protein
MHTHPAADTLPSSVAAPPTTILPAVSAHNIDDVAHNGAPSPSLPMHIDPPRSLSKNTSVLFSSAEVWTSPRTPEHSMGCNFYFMYLLSTTSSFVYILYLCIPICINFVVLYS